jgi:hypothetical protein
VGAASVVPLDPDRLDLDTDHHEQIKRAWLTCCRHRGAAWPFSADERNELEREQLARSMRDL